MGKLILLDLMLLLAMFRQSHGQLTHSDFEGQALRSGKNSRSLKSNLDINPPVSAPYFGDSGPQQSISSPSPSGSPSGRRGLTRVTFLTLTLCGVIILMSFIIAGFCYCNIRKKLPYPKLDIEEGKLVTGSGPGKLLSQYICWDRQVNPRLDQATEVGKMSLKEQFELSASREWRPEACSGTLAKVPSRTGKKSGVPSTERSSEWPVGNHEIDRASSAENSADSDPHRTPDFFQKVMSWQASSESPQEYVEG